MEKRKLGKSGIVTAPLAFGGNVFGWTIDEATSFALLDAFVAAGFDFIDTADVYSVWAPGHSGGESEAIIGKWLKSRGNRGKVTIATKVGAPMGAGRQGLSKAYIMKSVEDSLARLQTDTIDLYQAHRDDTLTPMQETLEAFTRLIEQGKVRAIGASNFTAERLAEALAVSDRTGLARYSSLQPLYNLVERSGFENKLDALCRAEGIGVIPYYALASGFLTGKYRSEADLGKSTRGGGVKKYLDPRGLRILAALDSIAERYHAK
ncbi:MAG: alcohol dehydrogenase, partial [Rhodospirillales bacterium]|nr:alcohol dehydrogenase [Rhodospirillales bacterium]